MARKNWFGLLFLALVITACRPAEESADSSPSIATSTQDDEADIKQLYKQMEEKWNAADLDGFMAIYADDIVQMAPGRPATIGREVIRSGYEKFLSEYNDTWTVLIEHIEISGDLAIVRDSGTDSWTPKDGGETTIYIGKALRVFRRHVDGSWKMIIEIWNPNEPNAKEFPG